MPKEPKSNINIKKVKGNIVISNNQTGGVTTHSQENYTNSAKKKSLLKQIGLWAALIIPVLAILTFLGINPKTSNKTVPTIKNSVPQHIIDSPKRQKTSLKKKRMKNNLEEPINISDVKGDVIISQNQTGGITAHTVIVTTSDKFQELASEINSIVSNNLSELVKRYPNHPVMAIQIESGDNMRSKVAMEFENILGQYELGSYPKGNTFIGTFPEYPVTIMLNAGNKKYIDDLLTAINPFITSDYHFIDNDGFPLNFVKFFINGKPTFDQNGKVTIN